jgi:hypothetical protein
MPRAWSDAREHLYEHIKDSAERRGESEDTAEEIVARTVNKERARSGEPKTSSDLSRNDISSSRRGGLRSHSGAGGRTRDQLYEEAKRKNVKGRSSMTKAPLEQAVGALTAMPAVLRDGDGKLDGAASLRVGHDRLFRVAGIRCSLCRARRRSCGTAPNVDSASCWPPPPVQTNSAHSVSRLDVDEAVLGVTRADEVSTSKPAPDVVHPALATAGVSADDAVLIGNAVWDVHAASYAGFVHGSSLWRHGGGPTAPSRRKAGLCRSRGALGPPTCMTARPVRVIRRRFPRRVAGHGAPSGLTGLHHAPAARSWWSCRADRTTPPIREEMSRVDRCDRLAEGRPCPHP